MIARGFNYWFFLFQGARPPWLSHGSLLHSLRTGCIPTFIQFYSQRQLSVFFNRRVLNPLSITAADMICPDTVFAKSRGGCEPLWILWSLLNIRGISRGFSSKDQVQQLPKIKKPVGLNLTGFCSSWATRKGGLVCLTATASRPPAVPGWPAPASPLPPAG